MNVKENLTRVREFISTRECFCPPVVAEGKTCRRCEALALLPESWPDALGVAARCLPWGAMTRDPRTNKAASFPSLRKCEIALTSINLDARERPKSTVHSEYCATMIGNRCDCWGGP